MITNFFFKKNYVIMVAIIPGYHDDYKKKLCNYSNIICSATNNVLIIFPSFQ